MSSTTDWSSEPASTSPVAAPYTYGQLTMNDPESPWKSDRASSSPAVDRSFGAADDPASFEITAAASLPPFESSEGVAPSPFSGCSTTCPPADSTKALIQTM